VGAYVRACLGGWIGDGYQHRGERILITQPKAPSAPSAPAPFLPPPPRGPRGGRAVLDLPLQAGHRALEPGPRPQPVHQLCLHGTPRGPRAPVDGGEDPDGDPLEIVSVPLP